VLLLSGHFVKTVLFSGEDMNQSQLLRNMTRRLTALTAMMMNHDTKM
jgi:hypothetical protein